MGSERKSAIESGITPPPLGHRLRRLLSQQEPQDLLLIVSDILRKLSDDLLQLDQFQRLKIAQHLLG